MDELLVPETPAGQRSDGHQEEDLEETSCCGPVRSKINTTPIKLHSIVYIVCGVLSIGLGLAACVFSSRYKGLSIPAGVLFLSTGVVGMCIRKHGVLAIVYGWLNLLCFMYAIILLIFMLSALPEKEGHWHYFCSSYDCIYSHSGRTTGTCCDDYKLVLKWENVGIDIAILVVGVIAMVTSLAATILSLRDLNWVKLCCLKKDNIVHTDQVVDSSQASENESSGSRSKHRSSAMKPCWTPYDSNGHRNATIILSIIHIIIGVISVGLGIGAIIVECKVAHVGMPIWTGILIFMVTGFYGLLSITKKEAYIPCFLAFSILAFFMSINMFTWAAVKIPDEHNCTHKCTDWCSSNEKRLYHRYQYYDTDHPYYQHYTTDIYPSIDHPYYPFLTTDHPYYPYYSTYNNRGNPYYSHNTTTDYPYYSYDRPTTIRPSSPKHTVYPYTTTYPVPTTEYQKRCCHTGYVCIDITEAIIVDSLIIFFGVLEMLVCMATFGLSFSQLSCYFCCRNGCSTFKCFETKKETGYQMVMTSEGNLMMLPLSKTQNGTIPWLVNNQQQMIPQHMVITGQNQQTSDNTSQIIGSTPASEFAQPNIVGEQLLVQGNEQPQPMTFQGTNVQPMIDQTQVQRMVVQEQGQQVVAQGQEPLMVVQRQMQPIAIQEKPMMAGQVQPMAVPGEKQPMVAQRQVQSMMSQGNVQPMTVQPVVISGQRQPMMAQGQTQLMVDRWQPMLTTQEHVKPMAVKGQGQPFVGHGQPFVGHGQSFVGHGQPFVGHGQPFVGHGQPFVGHGQVQPVVDQGMVQPLNYKGQIQSLIPQGQIQPLVVQSQLHQNTIQPMEIQKQEQGMVVPGQWKSQVPVFVQVNRQSGIPEQSLFIQQDIGQDAVVPDMDQKAVVQFNVGQDSVVQDIGQEVSTPQSQLTNQTFSAQDQTGSLPQGVEEPGVVSQDDNQGIEVILNPTV